MVLTIVDFDFHKTQIEGATIGSAAQITAIADYYQYLIDNDIEYGVIGKNVATNNGTYGQFANQMLVTAGADSIQINNTRMQLALQDIDLRRTEVRDNVGGGDGILTGKEISDYHYDIFGANGLPREAWGGALFEEFAGTGTWIPVAKDGDFSGVSYA